MPDAAQRQIIRDGAIVDDAWIHVGDEEALPARGDVILGHDRWLTEREGLRDYPGRIGVCIRGDTPLDEVIPELDNLALIALEFPAFKDGRCYSHARVLRMRYGFEGELRAVGDVLRDQLAYMARVGINAYELRSDRSMEDALNAFSEFSVHYQLNPFGPTPRELRRRGAVPAR